MGAHATIQIPEDVARRLYRQFIGPDTFISSQRIEAFLDQVLDKHLLNCVFGPWQTGDYDIKRSESELTEYVREWCFAGGSENPQAQEIKALRRILATVGHHIDVDWEKDPIDELVAAFERR